MAGDGSGALDGMDPQDRPWDGRRYLTQVQYADDSNLRARQSIYSYQQPEIDLWSWALGLARLSGDEEVLDVGCGNGNYLRRLTDSDHGGGLTGVDLSIGMLSAAAQRVPGASFVNADAAALPFVTGSAGLVMAMHMLYHVPDRAQAIGELARVTAADGAVLVVTNSSEHLHEMDALFSDAVEEVSGVRPDLIGRNMSKFKAENAGTELEAAFGRVEHHRADSALHVTAAEPVVDYAGSMSAFLTMDDRVATDAVMARIRALTEDAIRARGELYVTTSVACFVCRK